MIGRRVLKQLASMQKKHLIGEAFGLIEVVGDEDNLGAVLLRRANNLLDGQHGSGIEAGRGLIQKKDVRFQGKGSDQGQALLLTAGKQPRRLVRFIQQANPIKQHIAPFRRGIFAQTKHEIEIGRDGATKENRSLKDHALTCAM